MTRCMRVRRTNSEQSTTVERTGDVIQEIKKAKNGRRNGKNMTELRRSRIECFRQIYQSDPEAYGKLGSPKMMQAFLDYFNAISKDKEPLTHDHLTQWVDKFPEIRRSFATALAPKERGLGAFASVIGVPPEPANMTLRRRQDKQIVSEKVTKRIKLENEDTVPEKIDPDVNQSIEVEKRNKNSKKSNRKNTLQKVGSPIVSEVSMVAEKKQETAGGTSASKRRFTSKNLGTDEEVLAAKSLEELLQDPTIKTDEVPKSETTLELPKVDPEEANAMDISKPIDQYAAVEAKSDGTVDVENVSDMTSSHKISPTISNDGLTGWRNGNRGSSSVESDSDNLQSSSSGGVEFIPRTEFDPNRIVNIVTYKETPDGLVFEKVVEEDYSYGANLIVELRRICLTNEGLHTFLPMINCMDFMYRRQDEYQNFISSNL